VQNAGTITGRQLLELRRESGWHVAAWDDFSIQHLRDTAAGAAEAVLGA